MIKLLPCSYADSESITQWLNALSSKGYQVTSLNSIYATVEPDSKRRYYYPINSVTEQYLFSNNNACSKDHIKYKMKERGFQYIGKCGSYLFFYTEQEALIKPLDSKEKHVEAYQLSIRLQIIVLLVSIFLTFQSEMIFYDLVASWSTLQRNIILGCLLFPSIYCFLELIELFKKKKDPTVIQDTVESSWPETLKRIMLIGMIVLIFMKGLR